MNWYVDKKLDCQKNIDISDFFPYDILRNDFVTSMDILPYYIYLFVLKEDIYLT